MRFLLYVDDPNFVGYVIRKNASDLKGAGGAFDEAIKLFKKYDPRMTYTKMPMEIKFSNGAKIFFTGLDGQAGMDALQGKQISALMLDEATHFTEAEITWAESRLRTSANMIPNVWLTCNPDMDSVIFLWIKDYYLYPEGTEVNGEDVGGRANPERDGVVRYYVSVGNELKWADTPEELVDLYGDDFPINTDTGLTTCEPKSFTFISATCLDNPPLLKANPKYVSTLMNMPRITRERLLYGNWLAREEGVGYFKRHWLQPLIKNIDYSNIKQFVRAFDIAYTVPSESNPTPDYTASVLMGKTFDEEFVILHAERERKRAGEVEGYVCDIVKKDQEYCRGNYRVFLPEDPSAGKLVRVYWAKLGVAKGITFRFLKVSSQNGKVGAFQPFAGSAENGIVKVVENHEWNNEYFNELEGFDGQRSNGVKKDDWVDATSLAYNVLATSKELPQIKPKLLKMK